MSDIVGRLHSEFGGVWRPVVGNEERYYVSDLGQVYSVPRQRTKGGLLTQWERAGYRTVTLSFGRDDIRKYVSVHRIVARAFLGEQPAGYEVRH